MKSRPTEVGRIRETDEHLGAAANHSSLLLGCCSPARLLGPIKFILENVGSLN